MKTALRQVLAVALALGSAASLLAQKTPVAPVEKPAAKAEAVAATHEQVKEISVMGTDTRTRLQTLCLDGAGHILALVAPPRSFGAPAKDGFGEVHVLTADGKTVSTWKVKFHAHSLNVGPDGTVFVAGDGKVAKFDASGKQLAQAELPHIADLLKDDGELRKRAEQQLKAQKESFVNVVKQLKDRKAKLEAQLAAKKEEDRTPQEKRQLEQLEQNLKAYAQTEKYYESQTVDAILKQLTGRLRTINGIAVSKQDLFIACGETKGYGYAIWRMDHDFKNAKQVLSGIGGCCGQMDIQTAGADLLVAENTKHRFARYDREGKALGAWGGRGRASEGKDFGGCCNPMNVCVAGDIYTAESEGVVKRFSDKGDFLALVGTAKLQGGCKNVAVAVSKDGGHVFFCDQPGSRVIVLAKKK